MTGTLKPIKFENLEFYNRPYLYRGMPQFMFEFRLLQKEDKGYTGAENGEGELTFCSEAVSKAHHFFGMRSDEQGQIDRHRVKRQYSYIYTTLGATSHPLIMEINVEPYRNRLFLSNKGEGTVIKGPIDWNDVRVLYSSRVDKLDQAVGGVQTQRIIDATRRVAQQVKEVVYDGTDILDAHKRKGNDLLLALIYGEKLRTTKKLELISPDEMQARMSLLERKLKGE